jgi:LemA protein
MVLVYVIIAIVVVIVIIAAAIYNGLVKTNVRADEAWSDITVQLKRRSDLIPNLVQTVKGYATHEKTVFEDVTAARAQVMSAQGPAATAKADNAFQATMKSLFAVAENYPQLRASENFQELQSQLVDTEDKIQASRRFYNGMARDFNTKRKVFPTNIFANMLGFNKDREYFDVDESEQKSVQEPVKVDFTK